jgi:steroid delta-isomerase-like uncharacterized protein
MTSMTNLQVLQNALEAFGDPARRSQYLDLYSDDAALHGYAGVGPGKAGIRQFYESFWTSFPDVRVELQEVIESGDRLIVRFEVAGTQRGEFLGVPATGKPIRTHGITILRFANGKCCERWSATDFLNVLIQIGAFGVTA